MVMSKHRHVWFLFRNDFQRLMRRFRFFNHRVAEVLGENLLQSATEDGVVVGDQNVERFVHCAMFVSSDAGTRKLTFGPFPGALLISTVPPQPARVGACQQLERGGTPDFRFFESLAVVGNLKQQRVIVWSQNHFYGRCAGMARYVG